MARSRLKSKGRRESGRFMAIPLAVWSHSNFASLSPKAVKLLLDLYAQYYGRNNGDFQMTWNFMSKVRRWKSKDTLYKARDELVEKGLIEQTRQGGKHRCNLYAITWESIDDCKGKLDVAATRVASGAWKTMHNGN